MHKIYSLDDIAQLRESVDVECKLAQGRDGSGHLPHDIWETYSAFANTHGGDIFLGLLELPDESYIISGIENPSKVIDELLAGANDRKIVSHNLLEPDSIRVLTIAGKNLIHIHIPQAPAHQRPVYIGGNAKTGSYQRIHSSDMKLTS
ncbi:AlbA family DNA-binding domain-containing protein [Persicirhabdus sediminis]|uniref:ATP-binding protein n=1 Tax=Persicirhabdus sediminis TaxID=454144 RepID=A0A8J7MCT2_9BACT|nr:ATP-binding protein [Persicirhabdus sediminis]MBK1790812.1 ATP-binding protein [Persicirhabdus sediminis]